MMCTVTAPPKHRWRVAAAADRAKKQLQRADAALAEVLQGWARAVGAQAVAEAGAAAAAATAEGVCAKAVAAETKASSTVIMADNCSCSSASSGIAAQASPNKVEGAGSTDEEYAAMEMLGWAVSRFGDNRSERRMKAGQGEPKTPPQARPCPGDPLMWKTCPPFPTFPTTVGGQGNSGHSPPCPGGDCDSGARSTRKRAQPDPGPDTMEGAESGVSAEERRSRVIHSYNNSTMGSSSKSLKGVL